MQDISESPSSKGENEDGENVPVDALDAAEQEEEEIEDEEEKEEIAEVKLEQTDSDAYDTDLELEDETPKTYKSMTGRDIYLRSCEQLGVVPASFFLAHLGSPELNMSHHGLGPQGAKAIAPPLVVNTSIIDFNIEDNWITAEGAKEISEMLMENCYIANLNVANNKLGSKGAQYLCDMLMENTTLRSVNASGNEFKDRDAVFFCDAFRTNFRLKEFDLSHNAFCEIGGEWLGQAIAANESIESLNLSWNHLRMKGALAVCAGMKINITIRHLDLSWNGFANEGAAAMAEALKTNNTLTWLDLSHNRITGEGALLLAKALAVNDTLRTLKIGENPINGDGALALLEAIAGNGRSAMEDLDLTGVMVNEQFKRLAKELSERARSSSSRTGFRYNVNRTEDFKTDFDQGTLGLDPMDILQDFLTKKRLRLVDLFRNFDKDLSWKISPQEFRKGIENAGIRMGRRQMKQLISGLDLDTDGQVNYRELLAGRKQALLRKREIKRQQERQEKLKQAEQERFRSAWTDAIERAKSPSPSPRATPSASPRGSSPPSARGSRRNSSGLQMSGFGDRLTPGPPSPRAITNKLEPYAHSSRRRSSAASLQAYRRPSNPDVRKNAQPRRKSEIRSLYPSQFTQPVKYSVKPAAKLD